MVGGIELEVLSGVDGIEGVDADDEVAVVFEKN